MLLLPLHHLIESRIAGGFFRFGEDGEIDVFSVDSDRRAFYFAFFFGQVVEVFVICPEVFYIGVEAAFDGFLIGFVDEFEDAVAVGAGADLGFMT